MDCFTNWNVELRKPADLTRKVAEWIGLDVGLVLSEIATCLQSRRLLLSLSYSVPEGATRRGIDSTADAVSTT
jgi:hypothetical protein